MKYNNKNFQWTDKFEIEENDVQKIDKVVIKYLRQATLL